MEKIELLAAAQDKRLTLIVGKEDLAVDNNRRSRESFPLRNSEPALPDGVSGLRIESRCDAGHVVDHVEFFSVKNRRWNEWRTARTRPDEVRSCNVALSAGTDSKCWSGPS